MHHFSIGMLVFAVVWGCAMWAGMRWARGRLNRRMRDVAASLVSAGLRLVDEQPTTAAWRPATAHLEKDGRKVRLAVRQYGRDWQYISVAIEGPPMPAMLLRRERSFDHLAKAIGLAHEPQLGDREFDDAVYVASAAPEADLREALAPDEARRKVREMVEDRWAVTLSRDGLSAGRVSLIWGSFDAAPLVGAIDRLAGIAATLPRVPDEKTSSLRVPIPNLPVILGAIFVVMLLPMLMIGGLRDAVHPPLADGTIALAMLLGFLGAIPFLIAAIRLLRRRYHSMIESAVVGIAILATLPFVGALGLFAINSRFDHAAPSTHRVRVVEYYKHNKGTVYVAPWDASGGKQKVIVDEALLPVAIGDALEVDSQPGALGWEWASGMRRGR